MGRILQHVFFGEGGGATVGKKGGLLERRYDLERRGDQFQIVGEYLHP